MAPIKLVAFDLDGTLVDSAVDIARAVESMNRELGLPLPDIDAVRSWVGDGVRRLVKRALSGESDGEPPDELYQRGVAAFHRAYAARLVVDTRLYPHVREVLAWLQQADIPMACITNKSTQFTEPLLKALNIDTYFGLVLSGDTLAKRKPDPLPLSHAARHFGIAPTDACMVGDSRNDLLAARAAGFMAIGVRYGYGGDLAALEPDALLDSIQELPPLLANQRRRQPGTVKGI